MNEADFGGDSDWLKQGDLGIFHCSFWDRQRRCHPSIAAEVAAA
jgi:hypothetical protein